MAEAGAGVGDELDDSVALGGARCAGRGQAIGVRGAVGVGGAAFTPEAEGEGLGGFDHNGFIEAGEGGEGRIRTNATHAREVAVRGVEGAQHRIGHGAFAENVEAAAVAIGAGGYVPVGDFAVVVSEDVFGDWRENAGPAEGGREEAGDAERDVADDFGFGAETRTAGEELIPRIAFELGGGGAGGLLVGAAGNEGAHEVFLAPPVFHKIDGQPVEEVLVQGHRRARAEVLGRLDEARAEKRLPHAIHGDAGGEG